MFDFSESLNDVAPVSPILVSVDLMRMEECVVDRCYLCVVPFVVTFQIEYHECCV